MPALIRFLLPFLLTAAAKQLKKQRAASRSKPAAPRRRR